MRVRLTSGNSMSQLVVSGCNVEFIRGLFHSLSYPDKQRMYAYQKRTHQRKEFRNYLIKEDVESGLQDAFLFPSGLISNVQEYVNSWKYEIDFREGREKPKDIQKKHFRRYFKLPTIRDYQEDCLRRCALKDRGIIEAATGTGKSRIMMELIYEKEVKTLVIVPSINILSQMRRGLSELFSEKEVGQLGGGKDQDKKNIIVATYQSLMTKDTKWFDKFGMVCLDECLPSNSIITTDIGPKPIKWIVDNKYSGKVLSVNNVTGKLEWKKIINWWKRKNEKCWINPSRNQTLKNTDTFKQLWCTSEHKCAYVEDTLIPKIRWCEAKELKNKYVIMEPTNYQRNNIQSYYNEDQLELIFGTLLGDGSLDKFGRYRTSHGLKQEKYLDWKHEILGGCGKKSPKWSGFLNKFSGYRIDMGINDQTVKLREIFYNNKKIVPQNLKLTERSLAVWYMDDGSIDKKHHMITLHTEGFDEQSIKNLQLILKNTFDIESNIGNYKKQQIKGISNYYILRLNKENSQKLLRITAPFRCIDMNYKYPGYYNDTTYLWNKQRLNYGTLKIKNIFDDTNNKKKRKLTYKYDIEVEDNHNFFANGYLVHNCHHGGSETIQQINEEKLNNVYYRYYFTATPYRNDGADLALAGVTGSEKIFQYGFKEACRDGWLTTPIFIMYKFEHGLHKDHKEYLDEYKELIVENERYNQKIADITKEMKSKDRHILIFVKHIAHGEKLQKLISDSILLTGMETPEESKKILEGFEKKQFQVLIGTSVIGEGVDLKSVDCGIMAGAGKAKGGSIQNVGRLLRRFEGKENVIIADCTHHGSNFERRHAIEREKTYRGYGCGVHFLE